MSSVASHPPGADGAPTAATLLLVDDEASVLSALRRLFRLAGYETEQASSAADGLAILAQRPVDLVISDMRMPNMDGAAFLEAVQRDHPDTVRLLLTGYSDMDATVAAINRGQIHRYIAKPWDDQDLLLLVRDALQHRALRQQNAQLLALTQQQNTELQQLNQHLEVRVAARTQELEQVNQLLEVAYAEVNAQFHLAIQVFSGLLEMRQGGMAGHARRVSDLAGRVASTLGLGGRAHQDVVLGALLHDIGKLGFNDAMLAKPVSQYGPQEQARYQRHPVEGEAALMALERLHNAAHIVRQHHERVDGRGFPDQLPGADICLGAKIVAAASDYDGLVSGNLAEKLYSDAQARSTLQGGVGSHYDAAVVAALFQALDARNAEAVADRVLDVRHVQAGMVLSRDLLSQQGAVLLPQGYRFETAMVLRVNELARRLGMRLTVRVLRSSLSAAHLARLGPQDTDQDTDGGTARATAGASAAP